MTMGRIVVAGGGISGLALAHALLARGVEPLLLESEPRVGGKIRTTRRDGFVCEWGPASFMDREPAIKRLVAELRLGDRLVLAEPPAARRCVVAQGRLVEVPTAPLAFAASPVLPLPAKLRVLGELLVGRGPAARGGDESVADFARRRLGDEAARRLFYPLVSGLYAGDPEHLSVAAMFPWIADLERRHRSLLVAGARALLAKGRPELKLYTFRDGMEELTAALAARLGGRVRTRATVAQVVPEGARFRVTVDDAGRREQVDADAVVLAMPAHAAAPVLRGIAPALAGVVGAIPYAPVTLVYAGWHDGALARPIDTYGFFTPPGEHTRLLGAVFHSAAFAGRAPAGESLVAARLGGVRHPEVMAMADGELGALVEAELGPMIGARGAPSFLEVIRIDRALPQYTLGHRAKVEAVDAAERTWPGLFFHGNAYRGLGVPDCLRNACTVADRIAAFTGARHDRC